MPKLSAGLLLYRVSKAGSVEVLIVHPGGPFWARKDAGAWSIPKGEYTEGENPRAVAEREFAEELGMSAPAADAFELGEVKQPSGKRIRAWAVDSDLQVAEIRSNLFQMEWPRGSGSMRSFPEVDKAEWVSISHARTKLLKGQVEFLDRLMSALRSGRASGVNEGTAEEELHQGELF